MATTEHVIVIGAGVYGAAVTAALVRLGSRVTIVDSGAAAAGTSGATFSWTNSNGKQPRGYHDLNVAGMEAHRRLARDVRGSDWYHEGGNLEWADGDIEQEALSRKVDSLLGFGYEARRLTRDQVLRLEPDLNPAALPASAGIAYFPTEGWIEPTRLISHLLSAAGAGADQVWNDAVRSIDVSAGLVRSVRLASGRRLPAHAVVNCAGPRAGEIAALAGLTLPMSNTRGVLVYTSPVAVGVSRVVHAPRVHLRPDGAGRLLLHSHDIDDAAQPSATGEIAVDTDAVDRAAVDPAAVDRLMNAGIALYPGIRAAHVESVRIGVRPIPGDGLPVLGRAPGLANFHFAVSHSGATLCVHAGALVAAEVLGEDHSSQLAAFRVERF